MIYFVWYEHADSQDWREPCPYEASDIYQAAEKFAEEFTIYSEEPLCSMLSINVSEYADGIEPVTISVEIHTTHIFTATRLK